MTGDVDEDEMVLLLEQRKYTTRFHLVGDDRETPPERCRVGKRHEDPSLWEKAPRGSVSPRFELCRWCDPETETAQDRQCRGPEEVLKATGHDVPEHLHNNGVRK